MKKAGILIGILILSFSTITPQWTVNRIQQEPGQFREYVSNIHDANQKQQLLSTFLNRALGEYASDVVDLLIQSGAQVKIMNIVLFISQYSRESLPPDYRQVLKTAIALLQNFNINIQNKFGQTLLMLAIIKGATPIADALVQLGANVNLKDANGRTALMFAARKDNLKLVKDLLKAGANPDAKDNAGNTVLDWAQGLSKLELEKETDIAEVLEEFEEFLESEEKGKEPEEEEEEEGFILL